ncbi:hypothetical protein DYB28_001322, partial [Aphanomyces astaci]
MESCFSNVNGCNSCQLVAATASLRYDDYFTPFLPTNRSCEPAVLGAICPDADNGRCCVLANEAFDLYNPYRHLCSKPYAVNDTQSQHFSPNDRKVALAGTLGFKQQLGIGSNFTLETSWHVGQTITVTLRDNANGTVGSFELNSTSNKATWRDATTTSSIVVSSLAILTAPVQRIQFRVTSSSLQVYVLITILDAREHPHDIVHTLTSTNADHTMLLPSTSTFDGTQGLQRAEFSEWPASIYFHGISGYIGTIAVTWQAQWTLGPVDYAHSTYLSLHLHDPVYSPRMAPRVLANVMEVPSSSPDLHLWRPLNEVPLESAIETAGVAVMEPTVQEIAVDVDSFIRHEAPSSRRHLDAASIMLPGRLFTSMAFFNESVYTFHLSEWIESCIMMFHESMDVVDMSSLSVTLDWTGASLQNVFVSEVDDHNQPFDWLSGSWTSTTIAANTTISMVPTPHAGTLYVTLHGSFCVFNGSTYAQSSIVRLLAGETIDALDDVHITTTKVSAMATENGIVQVYPLEYFAVGLDLPVVWSEVQVYFSAPVASMATNATTSIIHATTYAGEPSWTWTNLPCATRISITPVDPLSVLIIRLVVKTYSSGHVVVTEITSQPRDCIPLVPLLVAPYPSAIIAASASTCRTQLSLPVFLLDDPTTTSLDVSVKLAPCSNLSLRWRGSTLSQSPNMSCTYNLVTGTNHSFVNDTLTLLVQSTSDMPPMISFTLEAVKQSTGGTSSHVALDWMDMLLPCIADSPSNNAILPSCIANPMHVTLFQADLPGQTPSEFRVSTTNHDWLTTVITFAMVPCIAFDMNVTSSSGAALLFEYNPTSCDGNIGISPDIEFMRLMVTPSHAYWQPKHLDFLANESAGLYDAFQLVFTADSYFDDDVSLQNMSIFQSKGAEDIHGELVLEAVTGGAMVLYHQYNTGNADNEQVVEYTVYLGQEGQGDESVAYSGQGIVSTGCHISNTLGLEIPATESDQMATPSSCAADCF